MRTFKMLAAAALLAVCASASAQPAPPAVTAADRAAILRTQNLTPNARGQVKNACDELVTPKFLPADLGGAVGTAILFVMEGGPNTAACYGDGPDLHLMKREGAAFREIYSASGRYLIILPRMTNGVRDIADGGRGFAFPLWRWNGTRYVFANRTISDAEAGAGSTFLP